MSDVPFSCFGNYDDAIRIENQARKCRGLNERVHQYYEVGDMKKPAAGARYDYTGKVPVPNRNGPTLPQGWRSQ
jgi:hypothetical protein